MNNFSEDKYIKDFIDVIDNYEVISFDIFDTLLMRLVSSPEQIFEKVGEKVIREKWLQQEFSAYEYRQIRIMAQKNAYRNKIVLDIHSDKEITLRDIYNAFPSHFKNNIDSLMKYEIDTEKQYLYINKVIYDTIKYCKELNKTVILVSDMYLSKNIITDILNSLDKDILSYIDNIYISCDYKKNKKSGKLFEEVCKDLIIGKKEIIHIGDNYYTDICGARRVGIGSFRYEAINAQNLSLDYEEYMYGDLIPELSSVRRLAANKVFENEKEQFSFDFGAIILGPIFTLYIEWVIQQAIKLEIHNIYPFMREANLLAPMLEYALGQHNIENISIKSMYVSRQATFLASYSKFDKQMFESFFTREKFSVENLFECLEIDDLINAFDKEKSYLLSDINSNEEYKSLKLRIFDYLSENKIEDRINQNIAHSRNLALEYFSSKFDINNKFITCDIGYKGTIPRQLNNIIKDYNSEVEPQHFIIWGVKENLEHYFNDINISAFLGNFGEYNAFVKLIQTHTWIIEELLTPNLGSTIGYKKNNTDIEVILGNNALTKEEVEFRNACREGIISFQKKYLEIYRGKEDIVKVNKDIKSQLLKTMVRVIKMPTYMEASNLLNLRHSLDYGTNSIRENFNQRDFDILVDMGKEEFFYTKKSLNILWPEAILTIKDPLFILLKVISVDDYNNDYFTILFRFCKKLIDNNITQIAVYGAGEIGRNLSKILRLFNIEVMCFIDKNELLWQDSIDNSIICSLQYAKENFIINNIVIASLSFINEIESIIINNFEPINVYKIKDN